MTVQQTKMSIMEKWHDIIQFQKKFIAFTENVTGVTYWYYGQRTELILPEKYGVLPQLPDEWVFVGITVDGNIVFPSSDVERQAYEMSRETEFSIALDLVRSIMDYPGELRNELLELIEDTIAENNSQEKHTL